ncbi:unnamed protein product [Prorocentrum cordatum]|uniref:Uncharacterized protein n=1 Tax=Prorocentrum cordatum TaxID=2364126 RepID=A0ABN9QET7_9DINO|nr:unnamed protein product [Polarella glacialis]
MGGSIYVGETVVKIKGNGVQAGTRAMGGAWQRAERAIRGISAVDEDGLSLARRHCQWQRWQRFDDMFLGMWKVLKAMRLLHEAQVLELGWSGALKRVNFFAVPQERRASHSMVDCVLCTTLACAGMWQIVMELVTQVVKPLSRRVAMAAGGVGANLSKIQSSRVLCMLGSVPLEQLELLWQEAQHPWRSVLMSSFTGKARVCIKSKSLWCGATPLRTGCHIMLGHYISGEFSGLAASCGHLGLSRCYLLLVDNNWKVSIATAQKSEFGMFSAQTFPPLRSLTYWLQYAPAIERLVRCKGIFFPIASGMAQADSRGGRGGRGPRHPRGDGSTVPSDAAAEAARRFGRAEALCEAHLAEAEPLDQTDLEKIMADQPLPRTPSGPRPNSLSPSLPEDRDSVAQRLRSEIERVKTELEQAQLSAASRAARSRSTPGANLGRKPTSRARASRALSPSRLRISPSPSRRRALPSAESGRKTKRAKTDEQQEKPGPPLKETRSRPGKKGKGTSKLSGAPRPEWYALDDSDAEAAAEPEAAAPAEWGALLAWWSDLPEPLGVITAASGDVQGLSVGLSISPSAVTCSSLIGYWAKRHELLDEYPVLKEKDGQFVAQFKFTLLLLPGGTKKITGLALGEKNVASQLSVQDEDLKKLLASSANPKKQKKKKAAGGKAPGRPASSDPGSHRYSARPHPPPWRRAPRPLEQRRTSRSTPQSGK